MIHQFDHRWSTYERDGETPRLVTEAEKSDNAFHPLPRYWVPKAVVDKRLLDIGWRRDWLMGWRDITNATNERTLIASVFPRCGVGNNLPLIFCSNSISLEKSTALIGNLNSLILDFIARLVVGGTHMNFFIIKQLPILPPALYSESDIEFIAPRVMALIGSEHPDHTQDATIRLKDSVFDNHARNRAELDAYYAKKYGLNSDELSYVMNPKDTYGKNYPSETFRILRDRELRKYGRYVTRDLIFESWNNIKYLQ